MGIHCMCAPSAVSAYYSSDDWPHLWSVQHHVAPCDGLHGTGSIVPLLWDHHFVCMQFSAIGDAPPLWNISGECCMYWRLIVCIFFNDLSTQDVINLDRLGRIVWVFLILYMFSCIWYRWPVLVVQHVSFSQSTLFGCAIDITDLCLVLVLSSSSYQNHNKRYYLLILLV